MYRICLINNSAYTSSHKFHLLRFQTQRVSEVVSILNLGDVLYEQWQDYRIFYSPILTDWKYAFRQYEVKRRAQYMSGCLQSYSVILKMITTSKTRVCTYTADLNSKSRESDRKTMKHKIGLIPIMPQNLAQVQFISLHPYSR